MNRAIDLQSHTSSIIRPESDLERKLLASTEFQEGMEWGKPRFGHPEGKVLYHVREVLDNVDKATKCPDTRERLRLVALVHDTFKYQEAQYQVPRPWEHNHARLAKQFMKDKTNDQNLLDLIEYHDEAYFVWRNLFLEQYQARGKERLQHFKARFEGRLQEYYLFFKCDTRTGDKNQAPLVWFESAMFGIDLVRF